MRLLIVLLPILFFGCKPTYDRAHIEGQVEELALNEYGQNVVATDTGNSIYAVRIVKNLRSEMLAEDQKIWTDIENLMMVLRRVTLSMKEPPEFFVLEIVDSSNSNLRVRFTRHIMDVKKIYVEAMPMSQFLDSLLIEFIIGGKAQTFDPQEMDLVRFLMLALSAGEADDGTANFEPTDVDKTEFMAKVVGNRIRRKIRENEILSQSFLLRDVTSRFNSITHRFEFVINMVPQSGPRMSAEELAAVLEPLIKETAGIILKNYQFTDFEGLTVIEKSSGQIFAIGKDS